MTSILSWNIQNGKGCDCKISLERIVEVIGQMGVPDIICLQEVSRGLILDDGIYAPDQVEELAELFPGYEIVFGAAIDAVCENNGKRWQFGNAVLIRLPLLSVTSHKLPSPGVPNTRYMARQAIEVVVDCPAGPLRVVNTHLEFHSQTQKIAQVGRLREIQREVLEEHNQPRQIDAAGPYQFVSRPVNAVFCGDFNMTTDSKEYAILQAPLADESKPFKDAWEIAHPGQPHAPTCGIYDHQLWPQGSHCRDFFFMTGKSAEWVTDVQVDIKTDASDHQPLLLILNDDYSKNITETTH
ncbi:MAG: endonuclease/exonuclease/phosphatase family metal-dependent hydrolase [Parasphingorhabdus sp.]